MDNTNDLVYRLDEQEKVLEGLP